MHDDDDKPRVLPFAKHAPLPFPLTEVGRADLAVYEQAQRDGYRQGYADGRARAEIEAVGDAERMRLIATWGMVGAFAIGGVFGVAVCRLVWPLVEAGVLP